MTDITVTTPPAPGIDTDARPAEVVPGAGTGSAPGEGTRRVPAGFPFYGTDVGIAILDSGIPRPVGDVGNAHSFPFPVRYEIVDGIGPRHMSAPRSQEVADAFVAVLTRLSRFGLKTAGSSCGLLAQYQQEVAERSPIPVALSSLLQLPLVLRTLPSTQKVLLVTIRREGIGTQHLAQSGVGPDEQHRVVIGDLPDAEHFRAAIATTIDEYDVDRAAQEVVAGVGRWLPAGHDIGAIVLECTNLAPFSTALRIAHGLPVWDVRTLLGALQQSVAVD